MYFNIYATKKIWKDLLTLQISEKHFPGGFMLKNDIMWPGKMKIRNLFLFLNLSFFTITYRNYYICIGKKRVWRFQTWFCTRQLNLPSRGNFTTMRPLFYFSIRFTIIFVTNKTLRNFRLICILRSNPYFLYNITKRL